jgi:hypothetical protein
MKFLSTISLISLILLFIGYVFNVIFMEYSISPTDYLVFSIMNYIVLTKTSFDETLLKKSKLSESNTVVFPSKSDEEFITTYIKKYPNDMELGAAIRKWYIENECK